MPSQRRSFSPEYMPVPANVMQRASLDAVAALFGIVVETGEHSA